MRLLLALLLLCGCHGQIVQAPPSVPISETLSDAYDVGYERERKIRSTDWMSGVNPDVVRTLVGTSEGSAATLEKVLARGGNHPYVAWVMVQKLAGFRMAHGDYAGAIAIWQKYSNYFPFRQMEVAQLIGLLARGDRANVQSVPGINSTANDYLPIPELSGRRMYFTAFDRPGGKGKEDIWKTEQGDAGWTAPVIVKELCTSQSESPDGLSPDGTILSVFGNYDGAYGNGDIFESRLGSDGWSSLRHLPAPINSNYFESDSFYTADGNALIFSSDRPGGYFTYRPVTELKGGFLMGNTDLYVAFRKPDGTWSTPRNLGPYLNTPGAERTPFLYADGKTLYFSSDGYNGFGRSDVYKSVRLDDTWLHWSTPENLGPLVNGAGQDWGFRLTAASDRGYFSGELPGTVGGQDIFEITPLPPAIRPASIVVAVRGTVRDDMSVPLESQIEWQDLATGQSLGIMSSKPVSGEFFIALPAGREYAYFARKPGYFPVSQRVDLRNTQSYFEKTVDIRLVSIASAQAKNVEIVLNNIFFESGSATLNPRSFSELDRLAVILKQNPNLRVEIQGHTDDVGQPAANLELSANRARSVLQYLVQVGISRQRLDSKGFGSTKPVAPNTTEEDRQKNRRVSFTLQ